jgi:RNA-directed DNA polymerase
MARYYSGMTVEALTPYLKENWPRIREELLGERYVPQPIRRVEIPPTGR